MWYPNCETQWKAWTHDSRKWFDWVTYK